MLMRKEDIPVIAQLLTGMKDAVIHLEKAEKKRDIEDIGEAKKVILDFQKKIDELL